MSCRGSTQDEHENIAHNTSMGFVRRIFFILNLKIVRLLILFSLLYWIYSRYYSSQNNSFSKQSKKLYHNKHFDEKVEELSLKNLGEHKRYVSDSRGGVEDYLYKEMFEKEEYEGEEILKSNKKEEHIKSENEKKFIEICVIITFTKGQHNSALQDKLRVTVSSMLKYNTVPLAIHIIGDKESQEVAADILKQSYIEGRPSYRMVNLDVDHLAQQLDEIVKPMQKHFSYKPGAYYNHALFFLSIAMHRVMPTNMHKVIMMDADLKFRDDIKKLYDMFDEFSQDNIIGIAREMQPVYRHTFWQYRQKNPGTRVGEPRPNGLTGFNSGVLLLHLDKMRQSTMYNTKLNSESLKSLTEEFIFKGHLGDQDFFTLLSMKYESLFYILPCEWNRQLCHWWRENGYREVFDSYYSCDTDIKIYHGNCNSPIPND